MKTRGALLLTRFWALTLLMGSGAIAGGRPRYGGTLNVTAVTVSTDVDPLLADTPVDAALIGLASTPLCRLADFSRPTPSTLRLTTSFGVEISKAITRVKNEPSPYRALVASIKSVSTTPTGLDLALEAPTVSLERVLCHPALSAPIAPYVKNLANAHHPDGRPYPDGLSVQRTDARTAERLLSQRRTHLVLGAATSSDGPQLFATYLVLPSGKVPGLREAVEATTERADLTRFFVRPPAAPLFGLLPPSLGGTATAPPRPPKPQPVSPPREVTLTFDASNDDHRAIAEKLQVKLQPLGFRLSFKPVSRVGLHAASASRSAELMLLTVLLPPSPAGAITLVAELGGERVPGSLGLATDLPTQDKLARELALSMNAGLGVIPLCVQGVGVSLTNDVQHLTRDAMGLPRLDDVFLSSE